MQVVQICPNYEYDTHMIGPGPFNAKVCVASRPSGAAPAGSGGDPLTRVMNFRFCGFTIAMDREDPLCCLHQTLYPLWASKVTVPTFFRV